jgi:hypothetical protein
MRLIGLYALDERVRLWLYWLFYMELSVSGKFLGWLHIGRLQDCSIYVLVDLDKVLMHCVITRESLT